MNLWSKLLSAVQWNPQLNIAGGSAAGRVEEGVFVLPVVACSQPTWRWSPRCRWSRWWRCQRPPPAPSPLSSAAPPQSCHTTQGPAWSHSQVHGSEPWMSNGGFPWVPPRWIPWRAQSFGWPPLLMGNLSPVPILPLLLDLSPNPRFCTFMRRGRVSRYLGEQGGVLFLP